ncbi:MAG: cation:proton antiporter, partial [Pseudomonadales bacterium]|nr:cation:proton antiporter [Pseudomonadales bacterium]
MEETSLFLAFVLIFCGAAILATGALYTRQPIIIAYVALGTIMGPFGFQFINDLKLLADISQVGIIFLLFLLGLDMQPQALITTLKKSVLTCLLSSIIFAISGFGIASIFGFTTNESFIIGLAMMFSSTIIGIKLLPTTVLHHKHTGELMVGMLLLQDIVAIVVLMFLLNTGSGTSALLLSVVALPVVVFFSILFAKLVIIRLIARFDKFHEYIFLIALGWCLGLAETCHYLGLSREIGAFMAGISLATSPISQYIALNLKPLRDFFLVIFFFCLGAQLNLN